MNLEFKGVILLYSILHGVAVNLETVPKEEINSHEDSHLFDIDANLLHDEYVNNNITVDELVTKANKNEEAKRKRENYFGVETDKKKCRI